MKRLSLLVALITTTTVFAAPPRSGTAKGSCSAKRENAVILTHAAAFLDTKRDGKPTVLVISDRKLPVEKWGSEAEIARAGKRFTGAVFILNKAGERAYGQFYWKGHAYHATDYLNLTLEQEAGGAFIGKVTSEGEGKSARAQRTKLPGTFTEPIEYLKFDAAFHATLK